jgi:hypothetical protein
MFDISDKESPRPIQHTELLNVGSKLTSLVINPNNTFSIDRNKTFSALLTINIGNRII